MLGYRIINYVTTRCNFFLGGGSDFCFGGSSCCHHHHRCCCHCFILGQMYCVSSSLLCYHVGHYLLILVYKNVYNLSAIFYITGCCCPLILALNPEAKLKSFMTTMLLYILYNIYQNNVYLFNTRRAIENKHQQMASNDLTFSLIIYIKYPYHMLEQVLEMTSFNSQTCLIPGEEVIKYCLKFLSRNYWYCVPSERVTACTIAACVVTLNQSSYIHTEKEGDVWMRIAQQTDWIWLNTEWHACNMCCWQRGEVLVNRIYIYIYIYIYIFAVG